MTLCYSPVFIEGVNEKSKDSFPLQASITKCQLFSFDAKNIRDK